MNIATQTYISFQYSDDAWDSPNSLGGQVVTPIWEALASVPPDSKYPFFRRKICDDSNENTDTF
ncbi:hypothetical protein [Pseudoalteromonas luteoviolacea]|uniref:hypothetical protein n=1 Tax=Pseudoalteromonas luteoviolacea TaxID=43657 RepID=UPI0012DA3098|nr:hypothetical protein [Pseudoalteromonas luteoviolacea]